MIFRRLRTIASAFRRAYGLYRQAQQARAEGDELALMRIGRAIEAAKAETLAELRCADDDPIEPIVVNVYVNDGVSPASSLLLAERFAEGRPN